MFATPRCSSPIFDFGGDSESIVFPTDVFDETFDETFGIDLAAFAIGPSDRRSPILELGGARRASPIADLSGIGRISEPFNMTLAKRSAPIFEFGGIDRLSPVFIF